MQLAPMTFQAIPNGLAGVDATLALMRQHVLAGKVNPLIRQFTAALVQCNTQKNEVGETRVIHRFVRDYVRYLKDIDGVETLQGAPYTLTRRHGDCDDKTILAAAMFASIGYPVKLVAVGSAPGVCTHVYCEVKIGPRWVACETTEPVPLGWAPPNVKCRRTLRV